MELLIQRNMADIAANFPEEITVSTDGGTVRYERVDDCYATRGAPPGASVLATLEDDQLKVCRGNIEDTTSVGTAVYRLGKSGPLAVPTGRVFVRFEESTALDSHRHEIERAGFQIESPLSWAPQAGWVRPVSRTVHEALLSFHHLEQIPGVERVEPQMLSPVSHRGDSL
jgi:hypothetical protein